MDRWASKSPAGRSCSPSSEYFSNWAATRTSSCCCDGPAPEQKGPMTADCRYSPRPSTSIVSSSFFLEGSRQSHVPIAVTLCLDRIAIAVLGCSRGRGGWICAGWRMNGFSSWDSDRNRSWDRASIGTDSRFFGIEKIRYCRRRHVDSGCLHLWPWCWPMKPVLKLSRCGMKKLKKRDRHFINQLIVPVGGRLPIAGVDAVRAFNGSGTRRSPQS